METRTLASFIDEFGGTIQTGPFGSQLHQHEYRTEGIPVVMPKDIVGGKIDENSVARVSEEKASQLSRHVLQAGTIVFPRRGEISKCALIAEEQTGYLCGTGCLKIEVSDAALDSRFLYYYLGLPKTVEWLQRNAVGTTMLNLNTSILGNVRVPVLPLAEQHRIAEILSAYDDLIENNRRRIRLLEESARLLYREWFVHLRFPGHEHTKLVDGLPLGWVRTSLGEYAPLRYGKALKAEARKTGDVPVFGSSGVVGTHDKALVSGPGIVVGRKGNVGSVFYSARDYWPIDTVYYATQQQVTFYLYHALLGMNFISTDVAVPGLKRDLAHSQKIMIPSQEILRQFEDNVSLTHQQATVLHRQNETLARARDLLLPRLMSGEIAA